MAQMAIGMTLSLNDAASAPLRAFTDIVSRLATVVQRLEPRLLAAAEGITRFGRAAADANVGALSGQLGALTGQLSALTAELRGVAGGFTAMGRAAVTAGESMNASIAQTETRIAGLGSTIKGIAALWAAAKIEKGVKESVGEAISYENTQTRLRTMNVSAEDRAAMTAAAKSASQEIPQFNRNEMLTLAIDLRTATGSVTEAIHMLPEFAKAAFNMKMATPEGKTFKEGDMLLIAKALEQRNATQDPARMREELDTMVKIYAATQGRVDAQQILGNLQYAKGGLGQTLDIGFMPIFAALIEQVRSGGGSGGTVGTSLTSAQRYVLGNVRNGMAAEEAAQLGLIAPGGLKFNRDGTHINLKGSNLAMEGAEQFQRNPFEWVQNYLKPALIRAGIDLTNDAAVQATLNKLFPNANAGQIFGTMMNRESLLRKDAGMISQSLSNDAAYDVNKETTAARLDAVKAQAENLAIVMGETLLPTIQKVAETFSSWFESMAAFFEAHPVVAEFTAWAAVIGTVALAVAGLLALFGAAGVTTAIGSLIGVVSSAAGGFAAFGAGIVEFGGLVVALLGGPLALLIAAAAALVIAWNLGLGDWLAALRIGGLSISDWATSLADTVATTFQNMWLRVKSFLGLVSSDAAQAEINANNTAEKGRQDALRGARTADDNYGHEGSHSLAPKSEADQNYGHEGRFRPGRPSRRVAGGSTAPGRRPAFNPDADFAMNEARREESALKANLAELDKIYASGALSVRDYYTDKQAALEVAIEAEIAALNRERAAFERAKNVGGMNRVDTQLAAARDKLAEGTAKNEKDEQRDLNKLKKDAVDMERALLMTSGQRRAAEALHVQEELADKLRIAVLNKDETGVTQAMADAMLKRSQAALDLKLRSEELGKIQDQYADRLRDIQNAERNGLLSQTAAEDQKLAIRKEEAALMQRELEIQLALAAAAGDEGAQVKIKKQIRDAQSVQGELPADQIEINRGFQTASRNLFASLLSGTKSVKAAFQDMGNSIFQSINQIVSKRLGDMLYDSIFGPMLGGGQGGGGFGVGTGNPIWSPGGGGGFGGLLGSIFGGGGFAGASATFAGTGGTFADALAMGVIPLASGTDYVPRDMLALIHEGERVMPAEDNAAFTAASGRTRSVNLTQNFYQPVDHRTMGQAASAAHRALMGSVPRGGT